MEVFSHGDMLGGIEKPLMFGKVEGEGGLQDFEGGFKNRVNPYHKLI